GDETAVGPQDITYGVRVSLGYHLPSVVRASERPWKHNPPLVTRLLERDRLFKPPVLEEAVSRIYPEAHRRISIRHTLERVVKKLSDRLRGVLLGSLRFVIDHESIGDQQRPRSKAGIDVDAR